LVSWEVLR